MYAMVMVQVKQTTGEETMTTTVSYLNTELPCFAGDIARALLHCMLNQPMKFDTPATLNAANLLLKSDMGDEQARDEILHLIESYLIARGV